MDLKRLGKLYMESGPSDSWLRERYLSGVEAPAVMGISFYPTLYEYAREQALADAARREAELVGIILGFND